MDSTFERDVAAIQGIATVPAILDVVCRTTGMGFAAVARVTGERWIACSVLDHIAFGPAPGGELEVETTLCHEVRQAREPIVIDNAVDDPVYCGHPAPRRYGFRSYVSVPIVTADGRFFGTLCAIDPRPARVNAPEVLGMFRLFAELIGFRIDAVERIRASEARLVDERREAELRERFVAVLGHDLRNPLASIQSGTRLLLRKGVDARSAMILGTMQDSVALMASRIDDLMDFARGRPGGGLTVSLPPFGPLGPPLDEVVEAFRASHPDREITADIAPELRVACDRDRIVQLFDTLLGNALVHGAPEVPVAAGASLRDGSFELWVANGGAAIPEADRGRLFQPNQRGAGRPERDGLDRGLYIASEIARAHGGTLELASSDAETRFTFRMPA